MKRGSPGARKTHAGQYGELTPLRQREGGGQDIPWPPLYPLRTWSSPPNQVCRVGRKIGEQKNSVFEIDSSPEDGKRIWGQKNIESLNREASAIVARSVSEEAA